MAEEIEQNDPFWEKYNDAPDQVKDFFAGKPFNDLITEIEDKYDLVGSVLGGIVGDYVLHILSEQNLSTELQRQLNIDFDKAVQIKNELLPKLFALDPLMKKYIQSKGDIFDFDTEEEKQQSGEQNTNAKVDYQKTMAKVMPQMTNFVEQPDLERLQNIVQSFFQGVRNELQTKQKLMDTRKIGGLEMDDAKAELIVNVLRNTEPIYMIQEQTVVEDPGKRKSEVMEKTQAIMNIANGDKQKLMNMWNLYWQQKDVVSLLACLRAMGAMDLLLPILEKQAFYKKIALDYLALMKQPAVLFTQQPLAPIFVQAFLKELLMTELKLDEQEAAQYISQLGIILQKRGKTEYGDMAYFDVDKKRFVFTVYHV